MNIIIENMQEQVKIGDELVTKIEKVAGLCLAGEAPKYDFEMCIILVSNEEIRVLNKEYRNIDSPTDVLSFPLLEARNGRITLGLGDKDPDSGMVQLGDIIISPEKALEQASEFGHGLEVEIIFLVIHGVLHLLGYDHENDNGEMFQRQDMYLQKAGEIINISKGGNS
jgi:probable rRNA maturation factor